ncbi:hypothetical protein BC832DRAFT_591914 [Gaertneriomyces semiglobifer]|nr:hypothetical protein BC832DRAFT_591914 [Gaertneriomyces semiglobifer]
MPPYYVSRKTNFGRQQEVSSAVFDAYHVLAVHHQRRAIAFLDQCRTAALQHTVATGVIIPGNIRVPANIALVGCGSDVTYFRRALQVSVGININTVPELSNTFNNFVLPAMTLGYIPPIGPAQPPAQPPANTPLLYQRPNYHDRRVDFSQLFAIEAGKMKRAFCSMVATLLTTHITQTLVHHLGNNGTAEQRKELADRTVRFLQLLFLISAHFLGNARHRIDVGNVILFGNITPRYDLPAFQQAYVDFVQPIQDLCLWAIGEMIVTDNQLQDLQDLPSSPSTTLNAMRDDLHSSAWKWKRLVKSTYNRAHLLLPLLQYLSEYEFNNRPPPTPPGQAQPRRLLSHVRLSPERRDRGPEVGYAQFDY